MPNFLYSFKFQTFLLFLPFIIIAGSGYLLLHSHQLEKNKSECWICRWRQLIFASGVITVGIITLLLAFLFLPGYQWGFYRSGRDSGFLRDNPQREESFGVPRTTAHPHSVTSVPAQRLHDILL